MERNFKLVTSGEAVRGQTEVTGLSREPVFSVGALETFWFVVKLRMRLWYATMTIADCVT